MLLSRDDVGLRGLGWELPYLRPCCTMLGTPWEGEEPPWIGLVGGGGPGSLTFWCHDHELGGGPLGCCWESLSTLIKGVFGKIKRLQYVEKSTIFKNIYDYISFLSSQGQLERSLYLHLELCECALSLLSWKWKSSSGCFCSGTCLVVGDRWPTGASFYYQGTCPKKDKLLHKPKTQNYFFFFMQFMPPSPIYGT